MLNTWLSVSLQPSASVITKVTTEACPYGRNAWVFCSVLRLSPARLHCHATASTLASSKNPRRFSHPGSKRAVNPACPCVVIVTVTAAVLVQVSLVTVSMYVVVLAGVAVGLAAVGSLRPLVGDQLKLLPGTLVGDPPKVTGMPAHPV